jgi:uncharacterized protein (DUF4415 family)
MSAGKIIRYTSEGLKHLRDESDWDRAGRMTDEDFEAADIQDQEVAGIDDAWMEKAEVVLPKKRRVYALYDEYVVEYFKKGGRGYQARMNAVLRAYVDTQLEKRHRHAFPPPARTPAARRRATCRRAASSAVSTMPTVTAVNRH